MVTHLAVSLRHSKDILPCSANSQLVKSNIQLRIVVVMQVQSGRCCKLNVTTINNCKYRLNKGLSQPQKDGWLWVYYVCKMYPLRTEGYLGSKVAGPQFKPAALWRGGCRTETQGSSETGRHMYLLSVFLTEFPAKI